MLIKLNSREIVDTSHILWVRRNGNYTDVQLKDGCIFQQIWDSNEEIWNQIRKAIGDV